MIKYKTLLLSLILFFLITGTVVWRPAIVYGMCPPQTAGLLNRLLEVLSGSPNTIAYVFNPILTALTSCAVSTPGGPTPTVGSGTPFPTSGSPPSNRNAKMLYYASQISDGGKIKKCGAWGYGGYCRHVDTYTDNTVTTTYREGTSDSNRYWCARFTSDVLNLTMGSNFSNEDAVVATIKDVWWPNGFPYLPYYEQPEENMKKVVPGCLMFQMNYLHQHTGANQHVSIVKNKDLDQYGNGLLETYDANGPVLVSKYQVRSWKFVQVNYLKKYNSFGCL